MKFMMPFVFLIALFTLSSCEKSTEPVTINPFHDAFVEASKHLNIEEKALDYTATFPSYLKENGFIEPKTDNEKATLGRVLFYDKNLSRTKEVSCASCHLQEKAFADGKKVSDGVSGRQTTRNSIGLGSAVSIGSSYGSSNFFGIGFFWDDRAHSVVEQSRASFSNSSEMDMDIDLVVERVKENQAYYKWLFMEAYPDGINETNILDAIQQFVNSMGSFHSRFDAGMNANKANANVNFVNFSDFENQGKAIFVEKCASCHSKFAARSQVPMANNGLYLNYEDKGKGSLTLRLWENGVFKVPALRNVALTAPYMHDGSLATLEDVVDHYINGIKNHDNLSGLLKTDGQPGLGLTAADKAPLVAFLKTLTDETLLVDERYSDPFK